MFSFKKVLICSTAYQNFPKKECIKMVLDLAGFHNSTVVKSLNNHVRFNSSFSKKEELSKSVTLAHHAYAVPYRSEDTVPIIILHGLLGSKSNWNSIAKVLMKATHNRMIITLDARNHGDSPHTDEFSYEVMVSDLVRFLKDKDIDRASFIGHSMGGKTCMLLALKYPDLVESLVVVDISPVGPSPSMLELPKLFHTINNLKLDPDLNLNEARKRAAAQLKEKELDDGLISFLMTNLVENEFVDNKQPTNWRWKFNLDSILKNFKSEICKFPVMKTQCNKPTLFVAGGNSDYIRKKDGPGIKRLFPDARITYIDGAGHWVHAEKPGEFLYVVTEFLNSVKKSGPLGV